MVGIRTSYTAKEKEKGEKTCMYKKEGVTSHRSQKAA